MAPSLSYAFTLWVNLAEPYDCGTTFAGDRRFIPISGGTFEGPKIRGEIMSGGGDWNAVRADGVVHVYARYTLKTEDGTLITITNEGHGRANPREMKAVFANDFETAKKENGGQKWYTKTWPRFEVENGPHDWLNKTCFVGDLRQPDKPGHVVIDVYEIL